MGIGWAGVVWRGAAPARGPPDGLRRWYANGWRSAPPDVSSPSQGDQAERPPLRARRSAGRSRPRDVRRPAEVRLCHGRSFDVVERHPLQLADPRGSKSPRWRRSRISTGGGPGLLAGSGMAVERSRSAHRRRWWRTERGRRPPRPGRRRVDRRESAAPIAAATAWARSGVGWWPRRRRGVALPRVAGGRGRPSRRHDDQRGLVFETVENPL